MAAASRFVGRSGVVDGTHKQIAGAGVVEALGGTYVEGLGIQNQFHTFSGFRRNALTRPPAKVYELVVPVNTLLVQTEVLPGLQIGFGLSGALLHESGPVSAHEMSVVVAVGKITAGAAGDVGT